MNPNFRKLKKHAATHARRVKQAAKAMASGTKQAAKAVADAWNNLTPEQKKALIALGVAVVVHRAAPYVTVPTKISAAVLPLRATFT